MAETYQLAFILAIVLPAALAQNSALCENAPSRSYCNAFLSSSGGGGSVYDMGRISVRRSLSASYMFVDIINKLLKRSSSLLSLPVVRALQDCLFLAELNIDFISTSLKTVNSTSRVLPVLKADDIQTWLSAILTNQQTCADGIQATSSSWRVKNNVTAPLAVDSKLYSLSLALFTKGWVPKKAFKKHKHNSRKLSHSPDNVVVNKLVTVNLNGSGDFSTINDAISAAPNNTNGKNGYFMIYITSGVYEEYISIAKNKNYLMMVGDGINKTIITGNRSFVDGWTTFNSATFAVVAPNFVAVNITFRNTAGAIKHQAVAVRNGADLSAFYNCSFEGYQDTLYTHSLRQFYKECDIYGTVDFIFGNAAVVFQDCSIYPRQPMKNQFNAITAQGRTDVNQNTGISIHNCVIKPADDLATSNYSVRTYLGRPWKEYSRTVYMQTFMDSLIDPAGFTPWSGDFALNTSYYAEFNNTGPGSDTSERVDWLGYHVINATDALNFTASNFVLAGDWLPQTGVPFTASFV